MAVLRVQNIGWLDQKPAMAVRVKDVRWLDQNLTTVGVGVQNIGWLDQD